jgi:hypothetical protein
MSRADWLQGLKMKLGYRARRRTSRRPQMRARRPNVVAAEVLEDRLLFSVTAGSDFYSLIHDRTLAPSSPGVLGNDNTTASGGSLSAVLVSGPSHSSSFTLNANGSFSYTPATHWTGSDSFTYYATDGFSNSGNATVSLSVTNTPPSAAPDSYSTWYDQLDTAAQGLTGVPATTPTSTTPTR